MRMSVKWHFFKDCVSSVQFSVNAHFKCDKVDIPFMDFRIHSTPVTFQRLEDECFVIMLLLTDHSKTC